MSDNVVSIAKAELGSERRAAFLHAVTMAFENYVEECGYEPDAIVYTFGGIKQAPLIGWEIGGESSGSGASILALAACQVMGEATKAKQGQ